MKRPLVLFFLLISLFVQASAQRSKRSLSKPAKAVVIESAIAVVRDSPGYGGRTVRRLRRGREILAGPIRETDGIRFVRVMLSSRTFGWIQREAIAVPGSSVDENRLLELILALKGFDQIEAAKIFLDLYPSSTWRPKVLLLFGDLVEEAAEKLSNQLNKRLNLAAVAAVGGPLRGYLLGYPGIERYRKIGIDFSVNPRTRRLHYDGKSWREIESRFPGGEEAAAARERLISLRINLERVPD